MQNDSDKQPHLAGDRPSARFFATLILLFALFALTFGAALYFLFALEWLPAATAILLAFGVVFMFDRFIRANQGK